jgi:hypothetical protein
MAQAAGPCVASAREQACLSGARRRAGARSAVHALLVGVAARFAPPGVAPRRRFLTSGATVVASAAVHSGSWSASLSSAAGPAAGVGSTAASPAPPALGALGADARAASAGAAPFGAGAYGSAHGSPRASPSSGPAAAPDAARARAPGAPPPPPLPGIGGAPGGVGGRQQQQQQYQQKAAAFGALGANTAAQSVRARACDGTRSPRVLFCL